MNAPDEIRAGGGLWGGRLLVFSELPSTNTWAMSHLDECRHGDVVWAQRQTQGRGRMARQWVTPANTCLTLSLVVVGQWRGGEASCLGQCAALAVFDTLTRAGIAAALKWPNDVTAGGAKISGILCEADPGMDAIVLGVGLNVNATRAELRLAVPDRATTSMSAEAGRTFDVDEIRGRLLGALQARVDEALAHGTGPLLSEWDRHDALAGCAIELHTPAGTVPGRYAGLDALGRLRLICADGACRVFWSGDVEKVGSHR